MCPPGRVVYICAGVGLWGCEGGGGEAGTPHCGGGGGEGATGAVSSGLWSSEPIGERHSPSGAGPAA